MSRKNLRAKTQEVVQKLDEQLELIFVKVSGLWRENEAFRFATGYFYFWFILIIGCLVSAGAYFIDTHLVIAALSGEEQASELPDWYPPLIICLVFVYPILFLSFFDTIGSIASHVRFTTFHEIVFLFFFIVVTVILFSRVYEHTGLIYAAGELVDVQKNKFDFMYFTVVTWTTLGFGDVLPAEQSKPIVVINVLVGVILNTGFIGAVVSYAVNSKADTKLEDEDSG